MYVIYIFVICLQDVFVPYLCSLRRHMRHLATHSYIRAIFFQQCISQHVALWRSSPKITSWLFQVTGYYFIVVCFVLLCSSCSYHRFSVCMFIFITCVLVVLYTTIDQKLVNSLHGLLNLEIGRLYWSCYYNRVQNTCPLYTHATPILQCVSPCNFSGSVWSLSVYNDHSPLCY